MIFIMISCLGELNLGPCLLHPVWELYSSCIGYYPANFRSGFRKFLLILLVGYHKPLAYPAVVGHQVQFIQSGWLTMNTHQSQNYIWDLSPICKGVKSVPFCKFRTKSCHLCGTHLLLTRNPPLSWHSIRRSTPGKSVFLHGTSWHHQWHSPAANSHHPRASPHRCPDLLSLVVSIVVDWAGGCCCLVVELKICLRSLELKIWQVFFGVVVGLGISMA